MLPDEKSPDYLISLAEAFVFSLCSERAVFFFSCGFAEVNARRVLRTVELLKIILREIVSSWLI